MSSITTERKKEIKKNKWDLSNKFRDDWLEVVQDVTSLMYQVNDHNVSVAEDKIDAWLAEDPADFLKKMVQLSEMMEEAIMCIESSNE